ncbi:MAG: hypothetical protein ACREDC_08655, partial [Bradyrhizobium sp.]
ALATRGRTPKESTLAEMDALWDEAKAAEKASSSSSDQNRAPTVACTGCWSTAAAKWSSGAKSKGIKSESGVER